MHFINGIYKFTSIYIRAVIINHLNVLIFKTRKFREYFLNELLGNKNEIMFQKV